MQPFDKLNSVLTMSDRLVEGFEGAIIGIIVGLVISAFSSAFPSPYRQLIEVINLVQSILVFENFDRMGIGYLAGWLCGMWLMWQAGVVYNLFGTAYTIVGLLVLFEKIIRDIQRGTLL